MTTPDKQENIPWPADVPSDALALIVTLLRQQSARERSLAGGLHRLAAALEVQNERILELLGQTASLVDALVNKSEEDFEDEDGSGTYLDGTRVRTS